MAFGAVYDGAFGVLILAATKPAAALLGLSVPDDPIYLGLNGAFLLILAAIFGVASFEPERYALIPPVSAAGRAAGAAIFVGAWARGGPPVFLGLGIADLAIGAATLLAWRRAVAVSH
jgi:hypothetical protein